VRTSGYGRPPQHSKRKLLNPFFANCGPSAPGIYCRTIYRLGRTVYKLFEACCKGVVLETGCFMD
jgi:hypothetical protein